MSEETLYIDSPDALAALCGRLGGEPWLALDTEFMREDTYFPELCLVQIATPRVVACIDPLAIADLAPLRTLLCDASAVKVFHAARQDLELMFHRFGVVPAPLFDTQIGAALLGMPEQIGYSDLVQRLIGVELSKAHTRTDWRARPLAAEQVRYAEDDVRFLAEVYVRIVADLASRDRLAWAVEDSAGLVEPALYTVHPDDAWERVKGAHQLRGPEVGFLTRLAAWREATAQRQNRPRAWILRDEVLVELARHRPATPPALAALRGMPPAVARRHGAALLDLLAQPPPPARAQVRRSVDPAQIELVGRCQRLVRERAANLDIPPSVLASRRELEALVLHPHAQHRLARGWRLPLVGAELLALAQASGAGEGGDASPPVA
ncbi:MAG: ribonuclease D [Gammaproteobacteria bacterium]